MDRPLIAVLDNKDQLLCVTDEYFDGNLHTFLQGTAAFFRCSVLQKSELSQYFIVGNKISFIYDDMAYHFDITDMVKNEKYNTIQADSLTLELRNEDAKEYKATKAMTFAEYLNVFLFVGDNPLVMGINEISDKSLQLEWEGSEDDLLARLFSLATKFDAEIEFVTKLNRHWGLLEIVLNVYKAHDDKNQGIGKNRQDIILEYGNNVETIEIHENIDNLKTAIKPYGTDGLTIVNVVIDERDEDGNQLYYSPMGDNAIRAVQARNQFISKIGGEGYIAKNWTYETSNVNTLAGQALAELKKLSKVELTVTIKSYEKMGIGDTVRALNTAYEPDLNLSVRVSEQDIYFDSPGDNTTTFTNVEILQSEVDTSLLARVQALIEENKIYQYDIVTDTDTFKNGVGSTTLTALVRDATKDITSNFTIRWYKNNALLVNNATTLTVNAVDVGDKAVYRYEAVDSQDVVKGGTEVTIKNVNDGTSPTVTVNPDTSLTIVDVDGEKNTPILKGEDGKTSYVHPAWKMADGRFAKDYPNENLFLLDYVRTGLFYLTTNDSGFNMGSGTIWALSVIENSKLIKMLKPSTTYSVSYVFELLSLKENTTAYSLQNTHGMLLFYSGISGNPSIYLGDANNNAVDANTWVVGTTRERERTFTTPANLYDPAANWRILAYTRRSMNSEGTQAAIEAGKFTNIKFEESPENTIYTKPPSEATSKDEYVPKFKGEYSDFNEIGSDNPDDYEPWVPFLGEDGISAPTISLAGATQAITVSKTGTITPSNSFTVIGTPINTTITSWQYSLDGGNFGSALPTGVTRSGDVLTINPTTATFKQFTIRASDGTVNDVFTISRIVDGGDGLPGSDAYTAFLTNESYTFAGSTTAALAGSTTTEAVVYKGVNKITPTSVTVGTLPTGLTASVSGAVVTFTAATTLVTKSGSVTLTIVADGKTFTKQFSYSISFQGGKGDPGKGVDSEESSYAISQDGTTPPTTGWTGTRPTPKSGWYMWTRTRFKYTDNTYGSYVYIVAQQGKDAVIIAESAPSAPQLNDLWQDPNDTTGTVKRWDGTNWIYWGISIDNLIVSNVDIVNGKFVRLEGTEIVGSKFINTFDRTWATGSAVKTRGELSIESGRVTSDYETYNSTNSEILTNGWISLWEQGIQLWEFSGSTQSTVNSAMQLTPASIFLNSGGYSGHLTASMVYDTGWVSLAVLKGSGSIKARRFMSRFIVWLDNWTWNGNGNTDGTQIAQLPTYLNPAVGQMNDAPAWSLSLSKVDRFQFNADGKIHKITNNSGSDSFRTYIELFSNDV